MSDEVTRYTIWDVDALTDEDILFVSADDYDHLSMKYSLASAKAKALESRLNAVEEALGKRFHRTRFASDGRAEHD